MDFLNWVKWGYSNKGFINNLHIHVTIEIFLIFDNLKKWKLGCPNGGLLAPSPIENILILVNSTLHPSCLLPGRHVYGPY